MVVVDQSTSDPPEVVGAAFAADVCRWDRQHIIEILFVAGCVFTVIFIS